MRSHYTQPGRSIKQRAVTRCSDHLQNPPTEMKLAPTLVLVTLSTHLGMLSAQKINGWYPCSQQTFASPTTATPGISLSPPGSIESIFGSTLDVSTTLPTNATFAVECAEVTMPLCHDGICNVTLQRKLWNEYMLEPLIYN
ncbi:Aste57867_6608 [Aphanomyces stellatus]|uniref:Aste57867_6608 protein n=1 Tax=Aphanomyces stellatus TaxID=120398 RepID=A0A485KHB1_9STRA|nr:hypothetical protein As57867_006590 [Aphanomyces stellatus]VFT83586.1 Aste57867_6608 [Aphanomyces stellatus]